MTATEANQRSRFLGLAGHDFTSSSPRELLEFMTSELRVNYLDYWPTNSNGMSVTEYQRLLDETGASVYVVNADPRNGRIGGSDGVEAGRENIRQSIDLAAALDVSYVQIYSATPDVTESEHAVEILADHLDGLVEEATDAGVTLLLENNLDARHEDPRCLNVARTTESLESLLSRVAAPSFGLTFDPANLLIAGGDPVDAYHRLRDRIFNVHVKDALAAQPETEHLAFVGSNADALPLLDDGTTGRFIPTVVGQGRVPWDGLFAAFWDFGYSGWFTLDPATDHRTVHEWCRLSLPVARSHLDGQTSPNSGDALQMRSTL